MVPTVLAHLLPLSTWICTQGKFVVDTIFHFRHHCVELTKTKKDIQTLIYIDLIQLNIFSKKALQISSYCNTKGYFGHNSNMNVIKSLHNIEMSRFGGSNVAAFNWKARWLLVNYLEIQIQIWIFCHSFYCSLLPDKN